MCHMNSIRVSCFVVVIQSVFRSVLIQMRVFTMVFQAELGLECTTTMTYVHLYITSGVHGSYMAQHMMAVFHELGANRTHVHGLSTHINRPNILQPTI